MAGIAGLIKQFEKGSHAQGADWGRPLYLLYKEGLAKTVKLKGAGFESAASKFVMDQHDPKYFNLLIGATPTSERRIVMQTRIRGLLTALKCAEVGGSLKIKSVLENVVLPCGKSFKGQMTFVQFAELTAAEQMEVIDYVWSKNATTGQYDTSLANMVEPNLAAVPKNTFDPLPSSVHPDGGKAIVKNLVIGTPGTPFKTLGVGFRVDGSDNNSVQRITNNGMTAQIANPWFMSAIKGWEVTGTALAANTSAPRLWSRNLDLLNESGVCVSRSFLGATAFPERTTGANGSEFVYLWAVSVVGLKGYDTETFQLTNQANWRPGEKAYELIPKGQVIGYIPLERTGGELGVNWKFKIAKDTPWKILNKPAQAVQDYIDAELTAWSGQEFTIDGAQFDFAIY